MENCSNCGCRLTWDEEGVCDACFSAMPMNEWVSDWNPKERKDIMFTDDELVIVALAIASQKFRDDADDKLMPPGYSQEDCYKLADEFEALRKQMSKKEW